MQTRGRDGLIGQGRSADKLSLHATFTTHPEQGV